MSKVRCNGCGYVGDESEFPKGRDFFQHLYVAACPKSCGNSQNPGDASMRMIGGERPFSYVNDDVEPADPLGKVLHRAGSAS